MDSYKIQYNILIIQKLYFIKRISFIKLIPLVLKMFLSFCSYFVVASILFAVYVRPVGCYIALRYCITC